MDTLYHADFLQSFAQYVGTAEGSADIKPVGYGTGRSVSICPEPRTFLRQLEKGGSSKDACRRIFVQELIPAFRKVDLSKSPGGLWFNTTASGINLRPGSKDDTRKPNPVKLNDIAVHGLIAGQTGSGKSVFLNNLIFNLLAEYAPWELDLYLADFKRVEFSRYMTADAPPAHICACAATGEIRYVLTLIEHLVDCMNAREDFFKRIGITKIEDFRKTYPQVVLPRILLIVDEFQQMFLEASIKENERIRRCLTAIVKKGRATGLHILFASQEMSGTLSRSDLANFRLRIALGCDASVSSDVLGNRAAAQLERGYVLVNSADGSEKSNKLFHVPLVDTNEKDGQASYFDQYIASLEMLRKAVGFDKTCKFYQEDLQEPLSRLETVLAKTKSYRHEELSKAKYFDILTLGSYVTFSHLRHDIQTLFIERGLNKNILAVSPSAEDIAYFQKLMVLNFNASPAADTYEHTVFSLQPSLRTVFRLEKELPRAKVYKTPEDVLKLEDEFTRLATLEPLLRSAKTPMEFVTGNIQRNIAAAQRRVGAAKATEMEEELMLRARVLFENVPEEQLPTLCRETLKTETEPLVRRLTENLQLYCRFRKNPQFPPRIFWISGADMLERLPDWLLRMIKNGMNYNMLFIFMATAEFDQMMQLERHCDYLFLGGNNSRLYDRLRVNFTHKAADSIVMDLFIKSVDEERSFKKYKWDAGRRSAPSIPFDQLLD